ncbi:MAG: hypothetical protein EOM07_05115 [Clostridia bacterium]|nr:hypothetical protein [Clostridia bacterium]
MEARSFNVLNYGATGDGVTDDAPAINALIASIAADGGTIFFPKGSYYLATPLNWSSHIHLKGQNGAVLNPAVNGIQASSDIRSGSIEDLEIRGPVSYAAGSKGIAFDEDNGGWLNTIKNVEIWNFEYGIYVRDIWWHNVIENVLCHNNKHGLYAVYKAVGSNINNTFINFYVDKPTDYAIMLSSARRMVFINPSIDTTTFYGGIKADLNCDVTVIGGNIEGSDVGNGQSIILLGMATKFTAIGLNISAFSQISGEGYHLNVDGTDSYVDLQNCIFKKVAGLRQIRTAQKSGTKILNNSPQIDDFVNATGDGAPGGQYIRQYAGKSAVSDNLNLSGGAAESTLLYSSVPVRIVSAALMYEEATDANAGEPVILFYTADNGYDQTMGTITTETSKAKGSMTAFPLTYSRMPAGRPLRAKTAGTKTGTGSVAVVIDYVSE